MKLTKQKLKEIIKEEIQQLNEFEGFQDKLTSSVMDSGGNIKKELHKSLTALQKSDAHIIRQKEMIMKEMIKFEKFLKKAYKELKKSSNSGQQEKPMRKTTVKEVKQWMKTLEENIYKKTYNSDCRRVSWLVNNHMTEDYEAMPISMKKKWSKAAYGRERQLAVEFLKHKRNEAKLKESIRKIVTRLIND